MNKQMYSRDRTIRDIKAIPRNRGKITNLSVI